MEDHKMTSEVLLESDRIVEKKEEFAVSKFMFSYPPQMVEVDEDGDLVLNRKKKEFLFIEHSCKTDLQLVGLQVWRGALLLADFIFSNKNLFSNKIVLELGSGVGLSSIIASIYAKEVICTDINLGNILQLIKHNFERNKKIVNSTYSVWELNFLNLNWSNKLDAKVKNSNFIIAADVIYDDKITEGFVNTLNKLLSSGSTKTAYVTLEKRYVFTMNDLDSVAPMYEEFLRCVRRIGVQWEITYIPTNFQQYFEYTRTKELIMMEIKLKKL